MAERLFIRDLMTVGVQTCLPDASIEDVTRLLLDKNIEGMVVLNAEGHALGVVCREDLVRAYPRDNVKTLTVEDVMRDDVPQLPPDIPLTAAAQLMQDMGTRVVFLMHHAGGIEYPAAMLSYTHLLRHLAARDEEELNDLGIAAARKPPLDTFEEKRDAARRASRQK